MKPLSDLEKNKLLKRLKEDLKKFHTDWHACVKGHKASFNLQLLHRFSQDILKIYDDAKALKSLKSFAEEADLVQYLLTTSWGAPFVEDISLVSAATSFLTHPSQNSHLFHLLQDFVRYSNVFHNQLYCVLEDVEHKIKDQP